jgi:CcmD family protein
MNETGVLLAAILVIWFGILGYLVALDRRTRNIQKKGRES